MPPRRRHTTDLTPANVLKASQTLHLPTPPATRLQLDIAYKRTANRFARYLAAHGIVGRRSWRLYKPYWRAYELLQKYILLVRGGWRRWFEQEVTTATAGTTAGAGANAGDTEQGPVEERPPPKPPDVLEDDRTWEEAWGGAGHWLQTEGDKEGEALWKEVREDISRP